MSVLSGRMCSTKGGCRGSSWRAAGFRVTITLHSVQGGEEPDHVAAFSIRRMTTGMKGSCVRPATAITHSDPPGWLPGPQTPAKRLFREIFQTRPYRKLPERGQSAKRWSFKTIRRCFGLPAGNPGPTVTPWEARRPTKRFRLPNGVLLV